MMQEQGMGVRKQHFSAVIHTIDLCSPVDFLFYSVSSVGFRKGFCETYPHKFFFFFLVNEPILYVHLSQIPCILKCVVLACLSKAESLGVSSSSNEVFIAIMNTKYRKKDKSHMNMKNAQHLSCPRDVD